jgi:hypothetical protein
LGALANWKLYSIIDHVRRGGAFIQMEKVSSTGETIWTKQIHEPLYIGVMICFLVSLFVLLSGLGQGIVDFHEFRQAQTVLTTYWMVHGGDLFAYETPVVGHPWVIPFELPVFQWVSALVSLSGLSIVESSRLVSWSFFIVSLLVAARTLARLDVPKSVVLTFVILVLSSPLYLYWSRAPLIESTATMFGAIFLLGLIGYFKRPNAVDACLLFVGLTLCALVKVTTVLSFAAAAATLSLWFLYQDYAASKSLLGSARIALPPIVGATIAFAILLTWLSFTDGLKAQNPFGATLTSSGLSEFNFGTLQQRLDPASWTEIFFGRSMRDAVGSPVLILVAAWFIYKAGFMVKPSILCIFLYFLPFMVFTNLHLVHNYYQYANSFFLILFLAFSVEAAGSFESKVFSDWSPARKKYTFLGSIVLLQLILFFVGYWRFIIDDQSQKPSYKIASHIAQVTKPDDVAFLFGDSWSSAVGFLSERRVIALPDSGAQIALVTTDMKVWTGDRKLAAIVDCETNITANMKPFIARISAGMNRQFVAHCLVYTPK